MADLILWGLLLKKFNVEGIIEQLLIDKDFAIGNDVVFLPDFVASFNPLFQKKVYTQNEIDYCEQFQENILRYASTWAAKEAVYKAVKQVNSKPLPFKRIEILREKISGKPQVILPDDYKNLLISLTISHDGDYVWAAALMKI
jgi:holo-[acyl-carrier protein] synthase